MEKGFEIERIKKIEIKLEKLKIPKNNSWCNYKISYFKKIYIYITF